MIFNELENFGTDESLTLFVDLILPVPIPKLFTYRVPRELNAHIKNGARVIVQFGKNRVTTALVARVHTTPPSQYQAKYVLELLDEDPLVTPYQLGLFEWMSEYYMCCIGEVMNVALPSGLKISSQSKVQYNPDFDYDQLLSDQEVHLIEELKKHQSLTYDELARIAGETNINPLIKALVAKRAIIIYEEVREKYKPKIAKKIKLNGHYETRENIFELLNALEKHQKQQEIILRYLSQVPVQVNPVANRLGVDKTIFSADESLSDSALKTLLKNGILEEFEVVVSRLSEMEAENKLGNIDIKLTPHQQAAADGIMAQFDEKNIVLLHGITGSGKTEVYIEIIQKALESGTQVLFLLPEIALTTQMVVRLKKVFGEKMGIYHSKFSDNERVEVWKGIVSGQFQFVLGVRSAIFLPFDNLGLIVVDEEHESSYKQYDPAPRYHARDVAMLIAQRQGAKVLLGSATPSVETYYQALQGRYGLVKLTERFANAALPDFVLVDTKTEKKQKKMKNEFSSFLLFEMEKNLQNKEQTILFQNRRGYSPYLQCEDCNWICSCDNCAVSLTYHQRADELRCHYCGHKEAVPRTCAACGSARVRTMGFGTEKIEDLLGTLLPAAKVQRMDLDTTRTKNAYQQIIKEFEDGNVDVLVGTQMISKGLDFDRVSLVGVFDADRMINFPDFRATERAFQLITQVSGRAGRRADRPGRVLIQTANPNQNILQKIINNDYQGFYEEEILERQSFNYPPFARLIKLTVRHVEADIAKKYAEKLAALLVPELGQSRVLGPEAPLVERVRNKFLFDVVIKLEREKVNFKAAKAFIAERIVDILSDKKLTGLDVVVDVDCV